MKKGDVYRYTLQFRADTEVYARVGEALERMRNRKSELIVSAVSDYLDAHPEHETVGAAHIERTVALTRKDVEKLVLSILSEKQLLDGRAAKHTAPLHTPMTEAREPLNEPVYSDADIEQLVDNLDLFKM